MSGLGHYSRTAAAFTAPEPAIPHGALALAHSALDDSLTDLADAISALEVRADSVLRPVPPEAAGSNGVAPAPSVSPAVQNAMELRLRLDYATARLRGLVERLDT